MPLRVRHVAPADIPALLELQERFQQKGSGCLQAQHVSGEAIAAELLLSPQHQLAMEAGGRVVAAILLSAARNGSPGA
jgi:hypothetical protein